MRELFRTCSTALIAFFAFSTPVSSELLFEDDFSTGEKSSNDYFSWSHSGSVMIAMSRDRNGESKPLMQFPYDGWNGPGLNDDKKWAEQRFSLTSGHREFTFSFWLQVPVNFENENVSGGNSNNKLFMFYMDGYSSKGDGSTVGLEYRPTSYGSRFYGKISPGDGSLLGGDQGSTRFITIPDDRGRWMQIGGRIIAESRPGAADGTFDVWRRWHGEPEFTKTHELTGQPIHLPDSGPQGIAGGYLLGYANTAFAEDTVFWIDDFRVGTDLESVGIGVDEQRPKAPTLQVN